MRDKLIGLYKKELLEEVEKSTKKIIALCERVEKLEKELASFQEIDLYRPFCLAYTTDENKELFTMYHESYDGAIRQAFADDAVLLKFYKKSKGV